MSIGPHQVLAQWAWSGNERGLDGRRYIVVDLTLPTKLIFRTYMQKKGKRTLPSCLLFQF